VALFARDASALSIADRSTVLVASASAGRFGCTCAPPLQASLVHVLPSSTGRSLGIPTSLTPPMALHCFCWQSLGTWYGSGNGVPSAARFWTQVLLTQFHDKQGLSWPQLLG